MKNYLFVLLSLLSLNLFAQKDCEYSTNIKDFLGVYKVTNEYLVSEKNFGGKKDYIFYSLITDNGVPMLNLQIIQNEVANDKATFTAVFEIESKIKKKANLTIKNEGTTLATISVDLKKGVEKYNVDFEITNPKLWWTNGLGEAYLYDILGEINVGGSKLSEKTRIGISNDFISFKFNFLHKIHHYWGE